jgi:ketosteroid isomerase-like protein
MASQGASTLIRALFAAFKAGDRGIAETLLADDFTFTSPYDDRIGKATYFERCWPNSGHFVSQTIERIFEQDQMAFVTYHCVTTDGKDFRNTEFFTLAADRITSVSVYFGATYRDGVLVP